MKKFVSIKGVIDNLRQSVNTPSPTGGSSATGPVKLEHDIIESLVNEQFTAESTLRHGFPFKPLSVAFDPVQKLLAIGNRSGAVRIYGKPGIDIEFVHESPCQVFQMIFMINSGKLLTACTDDTINLWDFKKKKPEVLQTLKFNRERVTCVNIEFQDKWLYIGTEKGNVYLMNIETFTLSGYQISWNKLIDPMQKSHPGAVSHLSCNPVDNGKILIGFETGLICLWDLNVKKGEQRYIYSHRLTSVSWNMDGSQFVCSHNDGSLVTWKTVKPPNNKPSSIIFPHGKRNKETGKLEGRCDPIEKVFWGFNRSHGDSYFVFSGGLPSDVTGVTPSITFMQGKNTTLLEMEYCVLDFVVATDSPYLSDYQEPESIIAMLTNDLVAIDCKTNGYPCFKNPYAMDFNESPVTCCRYLVDCPGDMIPAIYLVGSKAKQGSSRGFSAREWPINGGLDTGTESCSYTELVITGHADGSVRFWDASSTTMQALYKIKTSKFFERNKKCNVEGIEDDPYAVTQIKMCPETKSLCVAGASAQVMYFSFKKKDTQTETKSMEIPIVYEVSNISHGGTKPDSNSPNSQGNQHFEFPPRPTLQVASQSSSYTDPGDCFNFDKIQYEYTNPFRLRIGAQKKAAGFHAELVCLTPWVNGEAPTQISCLELSSNYGLMAYGNMAGLVIVDVVQNLCLLNMGTADLYGAADPFQRLPKSPRPFNSSPCDDIVRVDLSNYSQVPDKNDPSDGSQPANNNTDNTKSKDSLEIKTTAGTVKSQESKRLQKAGSSADEGSNSVSKSRSSSTNSLDQIISSEGVCSGTFVDSFPTKNEFQLNACLYVGTTLGSIIVIAVHLPDKGDPRLNEPVVVSPTGTVFRTRGALLTTCFLDTSSNVLSAREGETAENVHVPSRNHNSSQPPPTSAGGEGGPGGATTTPTGDQQVAVFCSDKSSVVYALPSQRQMYSQTINESSNVVTAEIINFGGGRYTPCLVCYTADGFMKAYTLPSLRPMLDMYYIAMSTPRIGRTMNISNYGHGIFFSNPTELQKFSISSEFMRQLPEMTGQVFTNAIPMPEPPKKNILFNLFASGPKPCDREELFGETAGKASSTIAKHIPGAGMAHLEAKSISSGSEISKAKMAALERGQKLNELEDRTEQMANEAKEYAKTSNKLLHKYKDKKWYQL